MPQQQLPGQGKAPVFWDKTQAVPQAGGGANIAFIVSRPSNVSSDAQYYYNAVEGRTHIVTSADVTIVLPAKATGNTVRVLNDGTSTTKIIPYNNDSTIDSDSQGLLLNKDKAGVTLYCTGTNWVPIQL